MFDFGTTPASQTIENFAGQNISSMVSASLAEALSFLKKNNKRWKGPSWRKFSTTRLDEPRVRAFMAAFNTQIEALAAWAVLEAIFNFLLRNLVFWESDPLGLGLPVEEWLDACRLGIEDQEFFFKVLLCAQEAHLLFFERNDAKIFISSPEIIDDADDYTKRLLRKTQGRSHPKQRKRESTSERLTRLEEQVAKLTESVELLLKTLQNRSPITSSPNAHHEEPSQEEKTQILAEFKEKYKLETDDWRKAVILLVFQPQSSPGPGYLARMTDLSQASLALTRWRERKKRQVNTEKLEKADKARVYANMVRDGFDFQQVPKEIAPLVQKILEGEGENKHAHA